MDSAQVGRGLCAMSATATVRARQPGVGRLDEQAAEPGSIPVVSRRERTAITSVGWLPKDGIDLAEWQAQGRWLGSIGRCSQWWLGDWVRFGTARYGEKYQLAAEITGYEEHSLRNMAYVASRFSEVSRRRDDLSFSHHAELAPLPPPEQDRWLARARGERLSVSALRRRLRQERAASEPTEKPSAEGQGRQGEQVLCCPNCGHRIAVPDGGERP